MTNVRPFIAKEDQEIPDSYGVKIYYVTGKIEEFELASHMFTKDTGIFEFFTNEDIVNWVPLSSIARLEFDKRFSKMVAIKQAKDKK